MPRVGFFLKSKEKKREILFSFKHLAYLCGVETRKMPTKSKKPFDPDRWRDCKFLRPGTRRCVRLTAALTGEPLSAVGVATEPCTESHGLRCPLYKHLGT